MRYQRKLAMWRSRQQLLESFSKGLLNFTIIASLRRAMNSIKESDAITINCEYTRDLLKTYIENGVVLIYG